MSRKIRWETRNNLNRPPVGFIITPDQEDLTKPLHKFTLKEKPRELYEYDPGGNLHYIKQSAFGRIGELVTFATMPQPFPP